MIRRLLAATVLIGALGTSMTAGAAPVASGLSWNIVAHSTRGVLVSDAMLTSGGIRFRAIRLTSGNVLLRWHVGSQDPPGAIGRVPADARNAIDWSSEGLAGVLAVFNGGFKIAAHAGGSMADGVTTAPLVKGDATIALNAQGRWQMGVWGTPGFPSATFRPIAIRQNLMPLVEAGVPTPAALSPSWSQWGSPLNYRPAEPRTALGVDAQGNLIYIATMTGVLPGQLARALASAGARFGMELDMNPYWPILGASTSPLHSPGEMPVQIPGSEHSPSVFFSGWERDFFVAVAEPVNPSCGWSAPGLTSPTTARPQPLHLEAPASFAGLAKGVMLQLCQLTP